MSHRTGCGGSVRRWPPALLLVFLASTALCAAEPPPMLLMGAWGERVHKTGDRAGQVRRSRSAEFRLGPRTYAIKYDADTQPDAPTFVDPIEGPVGMPKSVSENWYHSGFLFLRVDGEHVAEVPLSSFEPVETGERLMADMVWHHPKADARYRFIGIPGDDKLLVQIDFEPAAKPQRVELLLRAYPSFFTSHHKREGARRVKLPGQTVAQGEKPTLPAGEARWAVLYDEVFHVGRGEGKGPCGFAFLPDGVESVRVVPASYPVDITLNVEPETRRLRLAFWDFAGEPNADVLAGFPARAEAALAQLAALEAAPQQLEAFDPAAARAELEALAVSAAVQREAGAQVAAARQWLDSVAPLFDGDAAAGSIAAEEAFLAGLPAYHDTLWAARLAELLDF